MVVEERGGGDVRIVTCVTTFRAERGWCCEARARSLLEVGRRLIRVLYSVCWREGRRKEERRRNKKERREKRREKKEEEENEVKKEARTERKRESPPPPPCSCPAHLRV